MNPAREVRLAELSRGDSASFSHIVTMVDIDAFAKLSGDLSPIHVDEKYALSRGFRGRVAHGMFLGALASRMIGVHLPGKNSLLVKESLEFKQPVYIGDMLTVRGTVMSKSDSTRLVEILIEILRSEETIARGQAHVKVA